MPRQLLPIKTLSNPVKVFLAIFLVGIILSLCASGSMLLFSAESGAPLPPAADDLSTFDLLYLRSHLRLNIIGRDAGCNLFGFVELLMCCAGWVDDECFAVADICKMAG